MGTLLAIISKGYLENWRNICAIITIIGYVIIVTIYTGFMMTKRNYLHTPQKPVLIVFQAIIIGNGLTQPYN